jgi:hypothetical protein
MPDLHVNLPNMRAATGQCDPVSLVCTWRMEWHEWKGDEGIDGATRG